MDTQQLESFVAVADTGSFTRAAARLHRSQPGVSRQIQKLELELGAALLLRTPRGAQPTAEGREFLEFARRTVDELQQLRVVFEPADVETLRPLARKATAAKLRRDA